MAHALRRSARRTLQLDLPAETNRKVALLPERPSATLTQLNTKNHALLLSKRRKLLDGGVDTYGDCSDYDRAVAPTLVFAQEEGGTAVCISPDGLILTCAHCIAEEPEDLDMEATHWLLFASGQIVKAVCVAYDDHRDLALLRVTAAQRDPNLDNSSPTEPVSASGKLAFPCLPVASAGTRLRNNAPLLCVGHPGSDDLENGGKTKYSVLAVSSGAYHGLQKGQDPHNNADIGALKHSCWTYWSHSGAPLVNRDTGDLVGLHSSWDETTVTPRDPDMAMRRGVPLAAISSFLETHQALLSETNCVET